jgi:hypothetical protein
MGDSPPTPASLGPASLALFAPPSVLASRPTLPALPALLPERPPLPELLAATALLGLSSLLQAANPARASATAAKLAQRSGRGRSIAVGAEDIIRFAYLTQKIGCVADFEHGFLGVFTKVSLFRCVLKVARDVLRAQLE